MSPTGLQKFEQRDLSRAGLYSFENAPRELDKALARRFQLRRIAWEFFLQQPPGYRRTATFWIMSGKKEETRIRRLERVITASENGKRLGVISGASDKTITTPTRRKR